MFKRIFSFLFSVVLLLSVLMFNVSAKMNDTDAVEINHISLTVKPSHGLKNSESEKLVMVNTDGVQIDSSYDTEFYEIDTRRYVEKLYAGNSYRYHIYLEPCDGYVFADGCDVSIENASVEDVYVSPCVDDIKQNADVTFSFKVNGSPFIKVLRIFHNFFYRLFKFY